MVASSFVVVGQENAAEPVGNGQAVDYSNELVAAGVVAVAVD